MSIIDELHQVFGKYRLHPEFLGLEITHPDQPGAIGDTLLHLVARIGATSDMLSLLQLGAAVNISGDLGNTPLHQAAMMGQTESVRVLLAHGADCSLKNEFGQTARKVAELGGHAAIMKLLSQQPK